MREVLVDLIQRIPYGVIILHESWNYEWDQELSLVEMVTGIDENWLYTKVLDNNYVPYKNDKHSKDSTTIKPFLRPMSSMTEEEERELRILWNEDFADKISLYHCYPRTTEFYHKHYLDYRGLIDRNLAVPAPEGMYKIKK